MTDTAAQDDALETALDQWAVNHLEAAIALHKLGLEATKTTGYRHIGKVIAGLEPERAVIAGLSGPSRQALGQHGV